MTLEMNETCESCDTALAADGTAYICSYECSFCADCTDRRHRGVCPNCGGELVRRPRRAGAGA